MYVLYFNNSNKNCGVYQYGVRLYDILKNTEGVNYIYYEVNNLEEYMTICEKESYDAVLYNYHEFTMPWLNENTIQKRRKNIGLQHDTKKYNFFDYIGTLDLTETDEGNVFTVPRPLFFNIKFNITNENIKRFIEYKEDGVYTFGSFGFGFRHKNFPLIVKMIGEQYERAVIKFVMPQSYYCPYDYNQTVNECIRQIGNKNIKLFICHEFFSTEDLLSFLHSNDINIFLYDNMPGAGLSSCLDYAISVGKPIGISNSNMFRHIYSDEICLYKVSIQNCIDKSVEYYKKYLSQYSHQNLMDKFRVIVFKSSNGIQIPL